MDTQKLKDYAGINPLITTTPNGIVSGEVLFPDYANLDADDHYIDVILPYSHMELLDDDGQEQRLVPVLACLWHRDTIEADDYGWDKITRREAKAVYDHYKGTGYPCPIAMIGEDRTFVINANYSECQWITGTENAMNRA